LKDQRHKYIVQQYSQLEYQDGGIGYSDAEKILMGEGFIPISFPHHHSFSVIAKIRRFLYFREMLRTVKKGDIVVFLFPVYAAMNRMLLNALLRKEVTCVCFIADINGIKDGDTRELDREIAFLKKFRYFIVHNDKMKAWLNSIIPSAHSAAIDFFDFLARPSVVKAVRSFDIAFAGNLGKSRFLEKLHQLPSPLHFHLYGPGQTQAMTVQKNVSWHGIEKPYELPGRINGSFGLLWDGDDIEKAGGSLGEYMRYISHHKLSLYILSGLPVIVPAIAASADLVERYRIGFCVNNLFEIAGKINAVTEAGYREMQENMKQLAEKISKGECLKEAVERIIMEEQSGSR
jgi:glycosyltransferase involved in cell wall biosynthesis